MQSLLKEAWNIKIVSKLIHIRWTVMALLKCSIEIFRFLKREKLQLSSYVYNNNSRSECVKVDDL